MILIDTPVWSLALRRKPEHLSPAEQGLKRLWYQTIDNGQAGLLGPVRQELLSGLKEDSQFERLRSYLRDFPDTPITTADYEEAARANNQCRRAGIAASGIDMLICAVALHNDWAILTADQGFLHYRKVLRVRLANTV